MLSGNCSAFQDHSDQLYSISKSKDCDSKCLDSATPPGAATLVPSSSTPGDLAFAQKCADLHRFVRPLLKLLNGLKTGRFDKGLTSFQQSIAMDRLQRILGILQRPEMGEKYLQNLLQIEMMLKVWFPQVAFQRIVTPNRSGTPTAASRWRQNELHMPVKKRKLSWSDPDHCGPVLPRRRHSCCQAAALSETGSMCLPGVPEKQKSQPVGSWSEFTDSMDTLNRQKCFCSEEESTSYKRLKIAPPSPCSSPATQDSSVSSSVALSSAGSP
ncbi:circadian associated repressor of transcription a isoform X2 [Thalassophryne amazonica]|nr:circadian associated repressor of transcription a isoform X2 [Thalassophryne amazonica]